MPTRLIREAIVSSPRVNALSFGAEVFYRRLLSIVDDYGRFHASPATLRGACWPTCPERVTEEQVAGWLQECSQGDRPLVGLYEVAGARYLSVDEFGQQKRSKSKFPEPTATARDAIEAMRAAKTDCEQSANNLLADCKQSDNNCEQNVGTSRMRMRNSESKTEANAEAPVRVEQPAPALSSPPKVTVMPAIGLPEVAQRMYTLHPKTGDRTLVEHALVAAIQRGHSAEEIEFSHMEWCQTDEWREQNGRFVPKLARWLDDEGYLKAPKRSPPRRDGKCSDEELLDICEGVIENRKREAQRRGM